MSSALKILLLLGALARARPACGQPGAHLPGKVARLQATLTLAAKLRPYDATNASAADTIAAVNQRIARQLTAVLTAPAAARANLAQLLRHPALGQVHSADKQLWIFNWYENTGGSYRRNLSLVHCRPPLPGRPRCYPPALADEALTRPGFCAEGAWFRAVYKLRAGRRRLYLCLGSGVGCATCAYELATVVELTGQGAHFAYPAFEPARSEFVTAPASPACFMLAARSGDIQEFSFDAKTQTLTLRYQPDDQTPVRGEAARPLTRQLVFNGVRFTGNGYE